MANFTMHFTMNALSEPGSIQYPLAVNHGIYTRIGAEGEPKPVWITGGPGAPIPAGGSGTVTTTGDASLTYTEYVAETQFDLVWMNVKVGTGTVISVDS
jgi:hypothetical protein